MRTCRKKLWLLLPALCLALQACGQKGDDPGGAVGGEAGSSPVQLTVSSYATSTNRTEFETYMKPFVENKFPNIRLEWMEPQQGQKMTDLIAAGQVPDILATGYTSILPLRDLDIPLDLNEHVNKNRFDLGKFEPVALNSVKLYGEDGQLFALPYANNYFMTAYNKDVFDKFAVSYPKDGMTWDDAIELAKRLTRLSDGIQYRGLLAGSNVHLLGRGFSLPLVDPQSNRAALNTDRWSEVYGTMKSIYSLPGNGDLKTANQAKTFLEGNVAMFANWGQATIGAIQDFVRSGRPFAWDLVTYPHFKENPNNPEISTNVYVVSKTSKHPDEAFRVIADLASSAEVQTAEAKAGLLPVVPIDGLKGVFGKDVPVLQGKNVEAVFQYPSGEDHAPSRYDNIAQNAVNKYFQPFLNGELDVRTALSKAEEEANQNIAAEKAK